MSNFIDLAGQADVYTNRSLVDAYRQDDKVSARLDIVSESCATSLSRIFGALSSLSIVPVAVTMRAHDDETISVQLQLECVQSYKLDLLLRKFVQQTETIAATLNR